MLRLRSIERLLSRHRSFTALSGVLLVLGVAALNAHEALPQHHHHRGETTVCSAALSIAVLAGVAWLARRAAGVTRSVDMVGSRRSGCRRVLQSLSTATARAGPQAPVVLRL